MAVIPTLEWINANKMDETETGFEKLKVRRENLSEQVADQVQQLIVQGGLKPGDRLPSERVLGEQIGVSRTVIREAIKALQERGLLKAIDGSGHYVSKMKPEIVAQSISLFMTLHERPFRDLLEVRKSLEVEIAGLASERANDEEIDELDDVLEEMRRRLPKIDSSIKDMEEFVEADLLFHQILAQASKNSLLPLLLTPVTDLLLEFSRKASTLPGAAESAVRYHQNLLDCVRKKDIQRCREVMYEHMSNAEEYVDVIEKQH
jgi:GntR family transcriptional repressor for pyruvate dehydrogenase complex